jgi:hypothetical protein
MSSTTLFRVLALLAALVVVWGALKIFRGGLGDAPQALDLPRLSAPDVDRVDVLTPSETVRLARGPSGGWTVNGMPAAADRVNDLLAALSDTGQSSELVARSPGSHARLGVDSSAGRQLRLAMGDRVLLHLVFGSQGRGWQTAYVRRTDENEVYLLNGRLAPLVDADAESWRDRRIGGAVADSIAAIRIERGRRVTVLARADGAWRMGDDPADSAAVERLLQGLGEVTAAGFASAAQADSLDFARPDARLVVTGLRGDTLLGLAVDSTASGVWVRHLSGGTVFRLDGWRLGELIPVDSTLSPR